MRKLVQLAGSALGSGECRRRLCMGWGPPGARLRQHLLLDWEHWAACAEHRSHAAELWCKWHSWSSRETCHSVPSQGTQEAPPAPLGHGLLRSGAPDQELCLLKAPASRGLNALPYSSSWPGGRGSPIQTAGQTHLILFSGRHVRSYRNKLAYGRITGCRIKVGLPTVETGGANKGAEKSAHAQD